MIDLNGRQESGLLITVFSASGIHIWLGIINRGGVRRNIRIQKHCLQSLRWRNAFLFLSSAQTLFVKPDPAYVMLSSICNYYVGTVMSMQPMVTELEKQIQRPFLSKGTV